MVELRGRGGEVLTPLWLFLQKSPEQSWITGWGWGGGRQDSFLTSWAHQQHQTGAEPFSITPTYHRAHSHMHAHTLALWFCRSLAALQGPPQTLARTGSRRARITLLPVCLLYGTERWADIQAPQAAPKEGSLDLQTVLGRGGGRGLK